MQIDSDAMVSISDASQDFSRVDQIADAHDLSDDEKIDIIAARILKRFKPAFEELAK